MSDARSYHHGDLRAALIAAAEGLLADRGVEGFTLREAARRAGVSAAAPAHHFGDVRGLLTAIAVIGFETLRRYIEEGQERGGHDPKRRLREQGQAYVRFALEHPARFDLMFRRGRVNADDPELRRASAEAFAPLRGAIARTSGGEPDSPEVRLRALGAWSLVHGFARLAIDGELDDYAGEAGLYPFADRVLPHILGGLDP